MPLSCAVKDKESFSEFKFLKRWGEGHPKESPRELGHRDIKVQSSVRVIGGVPCCWYVGWEAGSSERQDQKACLKCYAEEPGFDLRKMERTTGKF